MDPLFTRAAWDALDRAADQAVERQQRAIEPRHVLLGVLEVGAAAGLMLRDLGTNRTGLVGALDDSLPRRQGAPASARPSDLPYTERAEEILETARALARDDGRRRVGTADLLLGLSAEKGITRTILGQFGLDEEVVRAARADRAEAIASEDRDEEIEADEGLPAAAPGTGEADEEGAAEPGKDAGSERAPGREPDAPPEAGASTGPGSDAGPSEPPSSPALEDAFRRRLSTPRPADESTQPQGERSGTGDAAGEERAVGQANAAAAEAGAAPAAAPATETGEDDEEETAVQEPAPARSAGTRAAATGSGLEFLDLDGSAERPLYRQIAEGIQEAAATGRLEPGARLPSIRDAAAALSVSSGTVARAYRDLEESEVVDTRGTRGTFVSAPESGTGPGDRIRVLAERLRPPVVAAYHMGVGPDELHRALDEAMRGILTSGE